MAEPRITFAALLPSGPFVFLVFQELIDSTPSATVSEPENVLAPERASVPEPILVRPTPAPLIAPETESDVVPTPLLATFHDCVAPRVTDSEIVYATVVPAVAGLAVKPVSTPPTSSPWSVSEPEPSAIVKSASRLRMIRARFAAVSTVAVEPDVANVNVDAPPVNTGVMSSFQLPAVVKLALAPPPSQVVPAMTAWANVASKTAVRLQPAHKGNRASIGPRKAWMPPSEIVPCRLKLNDITAPPIELGHEVDSACPKPPDMSLVPIGQNLIPRFRR